METTNTEASVINHQEIYRGKIVTLHVDTVRQASGKTTIREVVHHPGGVAAVPVLDDGRLLLIRQFRYALGKFILEIPAGKLDTGQSPLATMARELEEETGYRAGELTEIFSFYTSPGISDEVIHFFLARNLTQCSQHPEEGEHITVEKFSLAECLQKIQTGEIQDGKTIIGILWYHNRTRKFPP